MMMILIIWDMKNTKRIFLLGCGKSCDSLNFLEDLKDEYTLGISRWLFVKDFECDFYFVNDCFQLISRCLKYGGFDELKYFLESNDNTKWVRTRPKDIKYFRDNNITLGNQSYGCNMFKKKSFHKNLRTQNHLTRLFQYYEYLKQIGKFGDRLNKDTYSTIKLLSSNIFCGGAMTHALSLAYALGFRECYMIGFDVMSFKNNISNGVYSKYIMNYETSSGMTNGDKTKPLTRRCQTPGWSESYCRAENYKGMKIRRVVPEDQYQKELKLYTEDSRKVERLEMIKTISYEKFMYEGIETEFSKNIKYNKWV
jgi:hypothetical protein